MSLTLITLAFLAPPQAPPPKQELLTVRGVRGRLLGTVQSESEGELVFNPYRSTHREMTYGLERFAKPRVRRRASGVPPHEEFFVRFKSAIDNPDDLCALAAFARKKRLRDHRVVALEAALRSDPTHAEARKQLSSSKSDAFLLRDPSANEELQSGLAEWLKTEDPEARAKAATELIKKHKLPFNESYFARAYRSSKLPKGRTDDRKLTMHGDTIPGIYTLYVPDGYDPFTPSPLVIGLHGGGPAGPQGKQVNGNGRRAYPLYARQLRNRDYIAVFPNALRAPWRASLNEPLMRALFAEMKALFNIDLNRVYLAGHSMGGYGTWHFGPRYCDEFAAIGPLSGGGSNGLKQLRDTGTFVYLYHGADDKVVSCRDSRSAAKRMLDGGNDFIYTELPGSGHGLPDSIVREMFDYFDRKRLTVKKRVQARRRPSFALRPSKDEIKFFGKLR